MYHEERLIDCILCHRNHPRQEFKAYSLEELSAMHIRMVAEIEQLKRQLDKAVNQL